MSDSRKEGIDKLEKEQYGRQSLTKEELQGPMQAWWKRIFLILNESIL